MSNLHQKVLKRIKELKEISANTWKVDPEMKIDYELKSIRILGSANYYENKMNLNKHILEEFGDTYIEEVVVHEYAHFVVNERFKKGHYGYRSRPKPHGKEFKTICRKFGIEGSATTNKFSDSKFLQEKRKARKQTVHYYSCNCKNFNHELSSVRHNKVMRGTASYSCNFCKTPIKFVKSV